MRAIAAALVALLLASPVAAGTFDWPGGRKAAIVLTYDDALVSHLDVAAPQLEAAGLRGTFFLNGTFAASEIPRWRKLAQAGHELGNHSMFHPCPRASFPMDAQFNSERYTVPGMLREIGAMNTLLTAIDGQTTRTYSVPCSITLAGGVDYTDALKASGTIAYVRTGVPSDAVVSDPAKLDPFRVPSRSFPETATADDLIAYVKDVQRAGGLGVFMFHGVGGDYLTVSSEAHQGLLRYLKAHEAEIWVAPFAEVMQRAAPR
ncbi:polysaccharide deacetylase family protein [Caulobacter segnis]